MKKLILICGLCSVLALLGFGNVYANGNENGHENGNGHSNNGGQGGDGGRGGRGGNAESESDSESYSRSRATVGDTSSRVGNTVSDSMASVGNVVATVGNTTSGDVTGTVGDSTSEVITGPITTGAETGPISTENNIDIGGDTVKTKIYSYTAPSLRPAVDTETVQAHTIMGGVTLSNSEAHVRVQRRAEVLMALYGAGLVDDTMAKEQAINVLEDMEDATDVPELLGFAGDCVNKNLLNVVGLLCF